MATLSLMRARVVGTISGNSPQVGYYPEAASQSFRAGQFVYLVNGKVTVCADDASLILGMTVEDASGTTDDDKAVLIANGDTIFEANASNAIAITQVGGDYALKVVSNKCQVDISDTVNKAFRVLRLCPKDNAGDIYGRLHFTVIPAVRQVVG